MGFVVDVEELVEAGQGCQEVDVGKVAHGCLMAESCVIFILDTFCQVVFVAEDILLPGSIEELDVEDVHSGEVFENDALELWWQGGESIRDWAVGV